MSNADRVQDKQRGWRKAMPDVRERAQKIIDWCEGGPAVEGAADVVRRLLHLLDSADGNARGEERAAWDEYFAAVVIGVNEPSYDVCARMADEMLEERRKRFGDKR
jgi:hypothetical protein